MRLAKHVLKTKKFDKFVLAIILLNAVLLGIETYHLENEKWIDFMQTGIVVIFAIELFIRWLGKENTRAFFASGWNLLDMIIVGGCFIHLPVANSSQIENVDLISGLRILRILRIIETSAELKFITSVLLRSVRSVSYIGVLFLIFAYLYAVVGVALFKLPPQHSSPGRLDPYGNIFEALFTLFRAMTGDDWTDLRYDLLSVNTSRAMDVLVTIYHASWIIISAFLLLNLLVGAVLNNFDELRNSNREPKKPQAKSA